MQRKIQIASLAGVVLVVAALGLGAGAASGTLPSLLAPAGVSADVPTQAQSAPAYPENEAGLTFGSAAEAAAPQQEPDLIAAVATNGRVGYVLKVDLDEANGATAAAGFSSPEEALAWQSAEGSGDRTIPVYSQDGTTVIGEFLIGVGP